MEIYNIDWIKITESRGSNNLRDWINMIGSKEFDQDDVI